jgi:hypothetical protein
VSRPVSTPGIDDDSDAIKRSFWRLHPLTNEALIRSAAWLADSNEAAERGDKVRAEKCFGKSRYWLDRYNKLTGNA